MNATLPARKTPKNAPEIAVLATMPGGSSVVRIEKTVYVATANSRGFAFQKEAGKGGECYQVVCGGGRALSCSCPAQSAWGYGQCRHTLAAQRLLEQF